jgi:hypothetical protein
MSTPYVCPWCMDTGLCEIAYAGQNPHHIMCDCSAAEGKTKEELLAKWVKPLDLGSAKSHEGGQRV